MFYAIIYSVMPNLSGLHAPRTEQLHTSAPIEHYKYPFDVITYPNIITEESPHFNLSELVGALQFPVVEVGGPTTLGFSAIDGLPMKNPPIFTNTSKMQLHNVDRAPSSVRTNTLAVRALADVRNMPFKPNSIGVMLAAYLPFIADKYSKVTPENEATVRATGFPILNDYATGNHETNMRLRDADMHTWVDAQNAAFLELIDNGAQLEQLRKSEPAQRNPRIALQIAAREMLVEGGFLIMRGVRSDDIVRACALGLEVRRVQYAQEDITPERATFEEVIFQNPLQTTQ